MGELIFDNPVDEPSSK